MRIVIDMQGAQSESRFRGIGRYSLEFAKSVSKTRGRHEVILALNDAFPESIAEIRREFTGILPANAIRVWSSPKRSDFASQQEDRIRQIAIAMRARFIEALNPDIVHITSLFEGHLDNATTNIDAPALTPLVSCHCYDLIPMLHAEFFLDANPVYEEFYNAKLASLANASLILTISESAKQDIEQFLCARGTRQSVVNVSAGIDSKFFERPATKEGRGPAPQLPITERPFILYVGGADPTKNLNRLVAAYASLPATQLATLKLVLAGKMPEAIRQQLRHLAKKKGLKKDQLVIVGHVSDEELMELYIHCRLFVFPSIYEGFGLPPLEAMACGAPVLGSNTSSLPEVIGNPEALFDPLDEKDIRNKILKVLENNSFSKALSRQGPIQAKKFSWEKVGSDSWKAWGILFSQCARVTREYSNGCFIDSHMATITSALGLFESEDPFFCDIATQISQNDATGLRRQLFLDVSELSQHDAGTGIQRVVRGYLKNLLDDPPKDYNVAAVYASTEHGYHYAARFQSTFRKTRTLRAQEDKPIHWQRGDIFLALDCQHHVQAHHREFYRQLQSDGVIVKFIVYDLLPIQYPDLFFDDTLPLLHEEWLRIVAKSDGAICISQATANALKKWIASNNVDTSPYFQIESNHIGNDLEGSQPSTGRPPNADTVLEKIGATPTFLCVSTIEPRKQQHLILKAVELLWATDQDVNLVLVGRPGWKTEELTTYISSHAELDRHLFWLDGISDEFLAEVYDASCCVVAASLNEGFGLSLVEAAKHGKAILARNIPVFREIAGGHAQFFEASGPEDLANVLRRWLVKFQKGNHVSSEGLKSPSWQQSTQNLKQLLLHPKNPKRQLMVDISELIQHDAATGIQRVVKNVCSEWLNRPPEGFRVELVYATSDHGYKYAKRFMSTFPEGAAPGEQDDFIEYSAGDYFFALDLQPHIQVRRQEKILEMQRLGTIVKFMVYDLLPVTMPQFFPLGAEQVMSRWLSLVANSDGAVCISEATAGEFAEWMRVNAPERSDNCQISYAHLGSDFYSKSEPSQYGFQASSRKRSSHDPVNFLMVGTIEPRKGHAEVLDAFDLAWQRGMNVDLKLVGKKGWMCENLERRIINHAQFNRRLRWYKHANDTELEELYLRSDCLIAASYGEGFGLPLVEAAARKLPIIARNITVFQEIAGSEAYYFGGAGGSGLFQALSEWIGLFASDQHPKSSQIKLCTWRDSTAAIFAKVTEQLTT